MEIELPFPPSVNHLWRCVGHRMIVSRRGREYRTSVCSILRGTQPMTGRLSVSIDLYPPDRRRRDLDNAQKALIDSLAHGGAYLDDSQIDHLEITRRECLPHGKVIVRIEEMADGA